jgi:ketosteroid isomerase-like protein
MMNEAPQRRRGSANASQPADARLELLNEGIAAFNRGDAAPALEILAPDVECVVGPELMNTGTYVGHDGYLQMIASWGEAWGSVTAEAVAVEELPGDHLMVEVHQRAVGAGSGVPVEMTLYWLFQFVDGVVARFHLYARRDQALAATR